MRYMLLIHQGTTSTPDDPDAWCRPCGSEKGAVYAADGAIKATPGMTSGEQMQPPERTSLERRLAALAASGGDWASGA